MPMLTTVLIALAGGARPLAGAQPVGEVAHRVEHRVHVGDDVLAVDRQARRPRGSRSAVCSTARSSEVLMCSPANIASRRSSRSAALGQVDQQRQRLAGDAVLAVVDVEVADGQRQLPAAVGVLGEELAEVLVADLVVVADQRVPRGRGGDVGISISAVISPTLVRRTLSKV